VAVVDSRPFGGTCALRGSDPKKVNAVLEFKAQSDAEFVLGSAVRTNMTSYWVPIPYIPASKHCVKPRRGSRRSRHASSSREGFEEGLSPP
jgi:hypothetical protein